MQASNSTQNSQLITTFSNPSNQNPQLTNPPSTRNPNLRPPPTPNLRRASVHRNLCRASLNPNRVVLCYSVAASSLLRRRSLASSPHSLGLNRRQAFDVTGLRRRASPQHLIRGSSRLRLLSVKEKMGGGDCISQQTNEETKAMDVDTNDAPAAATIIPPSSDAAAAPLVNEENKDANTEITL